MDTVSRTVRSRIMASVRTKNTGPELRLRQALHHLGLRFRLHSRRLPGSADIVLPKFKAVIFVHGCFWHAHGCRLSTVPATRKSFWREKFAANLARDVRNTEMLLESGWRVITVWQCTLQPAAKCSVTAAKIAKWLLGRKKHLQIPACVVPLQKHHKAAKGVPRNAKD
jgi:DNA mismatch endonuclease (patch repair protein)